MVVPRVVPRKRTNWDFQEQDDKAVAQLLGGLTDESIGEIIQDSQALCPEGSQNCVQTPGEVRGCQGYAKRHKAKRRNHQARWRCGSRRLSGPLWQTSLPDPRHGKHPAPQGPQEAVEATEVQDWAPSYWGTSPRGVSHRHLPHCTLLEEAGELLREDGSVLGMCMEAGLTGLSGHNIAVKIRDPFNTQGRGTVFREAANRQAPRLKRQTIQ